MIDDITEPGWATGTRCCRSCEGYRLHVVDGLCRGCRGETEPVDAERVRRIADEQLQRFRVKYASMYAEVDEAMARRAVLPKFTRRFGLKQPLMMLVLARA